MNRRQIYIRLLVHFLFYFMIALALIFVLPKVAVFFLPFLFGWVLSMIANPLVRFLEQHIRLVRKHGSMLVIISVIAIIGAAVYGLCIVAVREVSAFITDLPELYDEFKSQMLIMSENLSELFKNIPSASEHIQDFTKRMPEALTGSVLSNSDLAAFSTASHAFHSVADSLLAIIMAFLSAYFFTVEQDTIVQMISATMPKAVKKHMDIIINTFVRAIGGYFRAQMKLAVVVFIILYIGFKLIGVKYSCLLASVVAFLDFLPVFGTGFVLWPWAVVDVIIGEYAEFVALLVIYLLCQLLKQLLQPKMVGDSIGMTPLATLIFLYSGYKIKGLLGMLIGIPVGMILVNFYQMGMFDILINDIKAVAHDLEENYWK